MRLTRTVAALLIALVCAGSANAAQWQATGRRALSIPSAPQFQYVFAGASGLPGWVTGSGGTNGTAFNAAGNLVAATTPRFDYSPTTLLPNGVYSEEARTNVVLWNRDLTNVAWTASNVTAAKDQTGIDGSANSASSITASAGNGTILQSITLASSARFQTAYVKRITGTGTVNMTTDNGSTWTAVTVTSGWTRVTIPTQTLANPTVGFRIVTSGDAVAVDGVQNENGATPTSVILTTTVAVARTADTLLLAGSALTLFTYPAYSVVVEAGRPITSSTNSQLLDGGPTGGGGAERLELGYGSSGLCTFLTGHSSSNSNNGTTGPGNTNLGVQRCGMALNASTIPSTTWGASTGAQTAPYTQLKTAWVAAPPPTIGKVSLGQRFAFGDQWINGWIRSVALYNVALSPVMLLQKTVVGSPY